MKVSDYRPSRPIILGDMGIEPKAMPKVSEADLLAMQPASTRKLLGMSDEEHAKFHESGIENWKAPEIKIEELWGDNGDLIALKVGDRTYKASEVEQHLGYRRTRDVRPYYRADKTSVIRPDNVNGDYEPRTPEWQKNIAKKTAEPDHPRLAEYKQPKEEWTEVSWGKAFVHWLKGDKVRKL